MKYTSINRITIKQLKFKCNQLESVKFFEVRNDKRQKYTT